VAAVPVGAQASSGQAPATFDVRITSADVTLAGVITLPEGPGPHPALLLVDGSGQTERSNMRELAAALAGTGYATLAYDKRGVGESTGDPDAWAYFDIADLATDAASAAGHLAAHPQVDAERVGILGISQGGWVAPHAATLSDQISFMVLMSPSVTTVAEDRIFERAARLHDEGFTAEEVAQAAAMQRLYHQVTRQGEGFNRFQTAWEQHAETRWFQRVYPSDALLDPDHRHHAWFASVLDYDPVPRLERLDLPVIWLFGDPEFDRLGPVEGSLDVVQRFAAEGKPYTVHVFPGTDHGLRRVDSEAAPSDGLPIWATPLVTWLAGVTQR